MNVIGSSISVKSFDIVVISLLRSSGRRAAACHQLDATLLPWSFLNAVDGAALASLPPEYDGRTRLRNYGRPMSIGQIGCFMSHRMAWKQCVQANRPMLVLEDDFLLELDLAEVLRLAEANMQHFDLLKLQGLNLKQKFTVVKKCGDHQLVRHHHSPMGTTAYIIKPEIARLLLEKSRHFHAPIDDFLDHDWIHGLKILSLLPYLVKASGDPSTIACLTVDKLNRWEKMLLRLRRLPRSVRRRVYSMKKSKYRSLLEIVWN